MMPSETFPDASTAINHGLNPVRNTMDASTLGLYVATVFLWGVSWAAIHAQLGVVAPEMSVLWRFLLAVICMWGWVIASGRQVRFAGQRSPALPRRRLLFVFVQLPLLLLRWPHRAVRPFVGGLLTRVDLQSWAWNRDFPSARRWARCRGRDSWGRRYWVAVLARDQRRGLQRGCVAGTGSLRAGHTVFLFGQHDLDFGPAPEACRCSLPMRGR